MKKKKMSPPERPVWKRKGVPQKGWVLEEAYDLREQGYTPLDYERCEMCGRIGIRFVNVMRNQGYSELLRVGRTCAAKMSGSKAPRRGKRKPVGGRDAATFKPDGDTPPTSQLNRLPITKKEKRSK